MKDQAVVCGGRWWRSATGREGEGVKRREERRKGKLKHAKEGDGLMRERMRK